MNVSGEIKKGAFRGVVKFMQGWKTIIINP
jgi:hypothetical protein